nr:MAG TPA: Pyocin activator protein PrtN [Caudoviricetes sp.]
MVVMGRGGCVSCFLVYQYDESHFLIACIANHQYLYLSMSARKRQKGIHMTPKYLSIPAFAEYVGLKVGTIRGYLLKNMLPEPDIIFVTIQGESLGWHIDTVEHWMNNRPGKGRTYASMKENN